SVRRFHLHGPRELGGAFRLALHPTAIRKRGITQRRRRDQLTVFTTLKRAAKLRGISQAEAAEAKGKVNSDDVTSSRENSEPVKVPASLVATARAGELLTQPGTTERTRIPRKVNNSVGESPAFAALQAQQQMVLRNVKTYPSSEGEQVSYLLLADRYGTHIQT